MAEDVVKTRGKLKSTKPGAGGGTTLDHPVIGIVKDNIDPTRSGKIKVQIEGNTNKQSNSSDGWTTVQYLSTYFGMVKPTAGQDGTGDYVGNPSAYGQWQSPPDIGTKVLCIFADGDPNRGFYVGCVVEPEAMQMVPAIGSSDNVVPNQGEAQGLAGASRLPVTSINTNNKNVSDSTNYLDAPKPVHSYTASIMSQQGIIRDPIRGPISSSASREPVSRVGWGVATPGRPIMEGGYNDENLPQNLDTKNQEQLKVTARRGGHSIVMDDGDIIGRDQLIRIRTALGHQILMSDDGQTLMILHSNGQSYIELGKEGTVDIFSTNSFNVRTQGDINFHADQHINLHASENMNIQAKNLHINTEEDFKMRAGKKLQLYSVEDFTVKSLGAAAIKSDGQASLFSSSTTFINGSKINLNTGKPGVTPAKVPIITLISQTDTLNDEQKGFIAAPGKLLTVTTRTPAHYPWSAAGQGVDVKSTLDASKNLPVTPPASVQKANQAGTATGAKAPAVATVASAPDTKTISKSMDKTVTNAVMGSVATSAATGPAKQAVSSGAAIVSTSSSSSSSTTTVKNSDGTTTTTTTSSSSTKVVAVGSYAQTPKQLVSAGVLKPGSDALINGLAQNPTANVNSIMTKNLFAGKPGAMDLDSFIQDTSAQTKAMVDNMQASQTTLSKVGVLTGKEAATQSAGLVMAAATVGVGATVDAVKQVAGVAITGADTALATVKDPMAALQGIPGSIDSAITGITSQVTGALGPASDAMKVIGAGVAAAGLANKLGGLGGISNSLKGLSSGLNNLGKSLGGLFGGGGSGDGPSFTDLVESVKGPAGAAFTAIRDSLKPLQAGVPQNLSSIAKNSAATVAGISSKISGIANESIDDIQALVSKNNLTAITDINALIENNTVAGIDGSFQQVKAQIGAMANDISSQSANLISQIGSSTTQLTNQLATEFGGNAQATVTNLSKSFNNISTNINQLPDNLASFKNPINLVNNVLSDIGSDITGITSTITTATQNLDTTLNNINTAVQDVSGMIGAAPAIATGNLKELASAATAVQSGASASLAAAMASGMNNLPGGLKSAGAVINNIEGAVNALPGTEALGELVKNVQTSVVNTAQDIGNAIDTKLGSILGKEGGLTNLITSALPLGAAAGLLSSLSALGAGGPAKIKLPTISFNTFDRASLDNQVKALLENPKIPIPNLLGEIKKETIGQFEQLIKNNKDAFKVFDEIENWNDRIKDATDKLYELENSLPAGDRGIETARNIVDSLVNDPTYLSLQKKADSIGDTVTDIRSMMSNAGQTAANMLNTADLTKAIGTVKSSATQVLQQTRVSTSVKTVTGQSSSSVEILQSKTSSSDININNSISGIIGPSTDFGGIA